MRVDVGPAVLSSAGSVELSRQLLGWQLPERAPTSPEAWRELGAQFARACVRWTLLDRYVGFSKRGYTRVLLASDEHWSLLLLGWLPGQGSPIHGHGESAGATRVLLGQLMESTFALGDGELIPDLRRVARESQVVLEGHEVIHQLRNEGREPALSLHLYAPPLAGMVDYNDWPVRAGLEHPPSVMH